MKKLILSLGLLISSHLAAIPTDIAFQQGQLARAQALASNAGKLFFVHFTASWCMPCQWMEENTFRDEALAAYIQENYLPVKVDFDEPGAQVYKNAYQVAALPAILVFSSQGRLLARYEETLSAVRLLEILQSFDRPDNRIIRKVPVPAPEFELMQNPPATYAAGAPTDPYPNLPPLTRPIPTHLTTAEDPGIQYPNLPYEAGVLPTEPALQNSSSFVPTGAPGSPAVFTSGETTPPQEPFSYSLAAEEQPTAPELPQTIPPDHGQQTGASYRGQYGVQVGAFSDLSNARRKQQSLQERTTAVVNVHPIRQGDQTIYKVVAGAFPRRAAAEELQQSLQKKAVRGFVLYLEEMH